MSLLARGGGGTNCTYDEKLFQIWLNGSNWSEWQLMEYECSYMTFTNFQRRIDYARSILYFLGGTTGIISAILALLTFGIRKREFAAVSFSYHRAINAIELPFMVLMIEHAVRDYTSPAFLYSYTWVMWFTKVSGGIDNFLPTSVNVITLCIAVERAVACLAPKHFSVINRPFVVWIVVFGSICISVVLWAPAAFAHTIMVDNRNPPTRYMPVWTEFGKGRGYRLYDGIRHILTLIGSGLMVLATVSAVVGLRRTAARSFRRRSSGRNVSVSTDAIAPNRSNAGNQNEYWLLLKNLSYLQLCETVPLIILHVLFVVTDQIYWDFRGGGAMAPLEVNFQEAMKYFLLAKSRQYASFFMDISNVAAHSFHFYWYLIFCSKIRHGFIACLHTTQGRRRRSSANGTNSGQKLQPVNEDHIAREKLFSKVSPTKHKLSKTYSNGTAL